MSVLDPPSVLVVEGDADTLRREGHSGVIDQLEREVAPLVESGALRLVRHPLRTDWDVTFAPIRAAHSAPFRAVLILAHASPGGLVAAAGVHRSWTEVGDMLKPLQPRAVLAIACFGGATEPARALFATIPSLEVVMGSVGPLQAHHATHAMQVLLNDAYGYAAPPAMTATITALNAWLNEKIIIRRTRAKFTSQSLEQQFLDDVKITGLETVMRTTKALLKDWLRRREWEARRKRWSQKRP